MAHLLNDLRFFLRSLVAVTANKNDPTPASTKPAPRTKNGVRMTYCKMMTIKYTIGFLQLNGNLGMCVRKIQINLILNCVAFTHSEFNFTTSTTADQTLRFRYSWKSNWNSWKHLLGKSSTLVWFLSSQSTRSHTTFQFVQQSRNKLLLNVL